MNRTRGGARDGLRRHVHVPRQVVVPLVPRRGQVLHHRGAEQVVHVEVDHPVQVQGFPHDHHVDVDVGVAHGAHVGHGPLYHHPRVHRWVRRVVRREQFQRKGHLVRVHVDDGDHTVAVLGRGHRLKPGQAPVREHDLTARARLPVVVRERIANLEAHHHPGVRHRRAVQPVHHAHGQAARNRAPGGATVLEPLDPDRISQEQQGSPQKHGKPGQDPLPEGMGRYSTCHRAVPGHLGLLFREDFIPSINELAWGKQYV